MDQLDSRVGGNIEHNRRPKLYNLFPKRACYDFQNRKERERERDANAAIRHVEKFK